MSKNVCMEQLFHQLTGELEEKKRLDKVFHQLWIESERKSNMTQAVEEVLEEQTDRERHLRALENQYRQSYEVKRNEELADMIDDIIFEIDEEEDKIKWNKYKAGTVKRLKMVAGLMAVLMLLLSIGYAWYVHFARQIVTDKMTIMTPYTLYLLEPGAEDYLELSIGDLHPGETKQIVVCVSSHDVGETKKSKDGVFTYTMELAYTNNLNLDYDVYSLTPVAETSTEADTEYITSQYTKEGISKTYYFLKTEDALASDKGKTDTYNREMYGDNLTGIINLGNYEIFDRQKDGTAFKLNLGDETNEYNYYLIEVTVDSAIDFNSYVKETDMIYLIAKAKLPQPLEITSE